MTVVAYKVANANAADGMRKVVVVTLEIPDDARHNMDRAGVVNKLTAQHRVDRAFVKDIQDADGNHYESAVSAMYFPQLQYRVGHLVEEPKYDPDVYRMPSAGIHVFLTRRVAEHYLDHFLESFYGWRQHFFANGQLEYECMYVDGNAHGCAKSWHFNGILKSTISYYHGKKHGPLDIWHPNGQIFCHRSYKDGHQTGSSKFWHENGKRYGWLDTQVADSKPSGYD